MQRSQLVINAGSTSIKYVLFIEHEKIINIIYEKLSQSSYSKKFQGKNRKKTRKISSKIYSESLEDFLSTAEVSRIIQKFPIHKIGFRYVHGGHYFRSPTSVTSNVLKKLKLLDQLAPLHNPKSREIVQKAVKKFPNITQILFFDTEFHEGILEVDWRYALPRSFSNKYNLRVYGFHGIVCSSIVSKLREKKQLKKRIIVCHLGGGSSVTAIQDGKSIKTSMGFSPLDGLVMTTRAGSIDPGILFYLLKKKNMGYKNIEKILNLESGLKGLAGTRDMREVLRMVKKNDKKANIALEIFCKRAAEEIALQMVSLGEIDQIIFSGGIGENASLVRKKICDFLHPFGIKINNKRNMNAKEGENFSKRFTKTKLKWFHADEAGEINSQLLAERADKE